MTPSWYDVLGVDDTATTDEIRASWQESVAGLDPTDRRFKQRNRAAEVLLDPERRAAHDAVLAAEADDADDTDADTDDSDADAEDTVTQDGPAVVLDKGASRSPVGTATRSAAEPGRAQLIVTVALGVLALLLVVATVVAVAADDDAGGPGSSDSAVLPDTREIQAARKAAETAIGPVLSYDYRDLEASREAATSFMTPRYAEVYEQNFAGLIEDNAPATKTIVTAEVVQTGTVRTGKDRVDVLVFVNRPTRNASGDKVSRDQVTVRMLDVDGTWLVDCLVTSPGGTC